MSKTLRNFFIIGVTIVLSSFILYKTNQLDSEAKKQQNKTLQYNHNKLTSVVNSADEAA